MSSNYGMGARAGDPDAPWNQPDDDREPVWFEATNVTLSILARDEEECREILSDILRSRIAGRKERRDVEIDHEGWRIAE